MSTNMSESIKHVATLGNSIIGVSVLAMPFCFKQCGILLGTLMLIASALLTRFNCHLLLKGALLSRRKTYELFAFYCFGYYGKLVVETSIIGFLVGILISFFVVIGDLGPPIISKSFEIENLPPLRTLVLTALGIGVALPLGLLKNISSLGGISTLSILFYISLVLKVFFEAVPVLATGAWIDKVTFWQPQGILQSLPIFALALSCQTQIFEIYNALPDSSLGKMNKVIKMAVYLCTTIYICVGFFGYVAFCNEDFSGNLLVMMPSSLMTQLMKLGFIVSVVLSFPLVIFPCRASLYSLFNRKVHTALDSGVSAFIPESRFRFLTVAIVVSTLILGILCPNIQLVLGIVGSTIGTVICIIFPALMFIRVTNRNTFERTGAQVVFCVGVFLLVASTVATLHNSTVEAPTPTNRPIKIELHPELQKKYDYVPVPAKTPVLNQVVTTKKVKEKTPIIETQVIKEIKSDKIEKIPQVGRDEQRRQEPPVPQDEQRRQEPPVPQEEHQLLPVVQERSHQEPPESNVRVNQEASVNRAEQSAQEVPIPREQSRQEPPVPQEQARQEPPIPQEPIPQELSRQEPPNPQEQGRQEPPIPIKQLNARIALEQRAIIPEEAKPVPQEQEKRQEPPIPQEPETDKIKDGIKSKPVIQEKEKERVTVEVAVQQAEILKQLAEQQKEAKKLIQEQKQVLEELKAHKELHQPEEMVEKKAKDVKKNSTEERRNVVVELMEKRKEKKPKNLTVVPVDLNGPAVVDTNVKIEDKISKEIKPEVQTNPRPLTSTANKTKNMAPVMADKSKAEIR